MRSASLALISSQVITPLQVIRDGVVLVDNGTISAVGKQANFPIPETHELVDFGDLVISPGFIDIHNHGGMGTTVSLDGEKALKAVCPRLVETGCTGWLPTVNTMQCLSIIVDWINHAPGGAEVLGIHMEGPFLAPKDIKGIQGLDIGLETPSVERFNEFVKAAQGHLKIMGISIELENSDEIIKEMRMLGIVPAVAHTKATYEQFLRAVELGIRHVTHTYNVMTGLHHRKPGVVGGVLTCDQVTGELIADGVHVSPVAMDVLIRCKGTDKICVITDNTAVAGLADGEFELGGRKLVKKNGETRFANSTADMDHTMAGSEWPINHGVHNLVKLVGVSLPDAIKMASLNPARVIGVDKTKGSLEPGKDADIIVIDDDLNVHLTLVKGRVEYNPVGYVLN
jgi:N-acetylglucosamine-6-phosphate deacetylase